jgi:hypothetical protein
VTPRQCSFDLIRLPSASGRVLLIWEEGKSHRPVYRAMSVETSLAKNGSGVHCITVLASLSTSNMLIMPMYTRHGFNALKVRGGIWVLTQILSNMDSMGISSYMLIYFIANTYLWFPKGVGEREGGGGRQSDQRTVHVYNIALQPQPTVC